MAAVLHEGLGGLPELGGGPPSGGGVPEAGGGLGPAALVAGSLR